jgi:hypothetical protein
VKMGPKPCAFATAHPTDIVHKEAHEKFGKHTEREAKYRLEKVLFDVMKKFDWSRPAITMTFNMNRCRSCMWRLWCRHYCICRNCTTYLRYVNEEQWQLNDIKNAIATN